MEVKRQTFLDYQFNLLQEYMKKKQELRKEKEKERQRQQYLKAKSDPVKRAKMLSNAKKYYYKKQIELLEANETIDEISKENEQLKKLIENLENSGAVSHIKE